jgi:hypothetical protein
MSPVGTCTQAKLKAVLKPGSQQYRFIDRKVFRIFEKIRKNVKFLWKGGRGDTVQGREGRREGGKWEPKGKEDQGKGGQQ